jgi:hypothetical protein
MVKDLGSVLMAQEHQNSRVFISFFFPSYADWRYWLS